MSQFRAEQRRKHENRCLLFLELRKSGLKFREIAEIHNISTARVQQLVKTGKTLLEKRNDSPTDNAGTGRQAQG